MTRLVAPLVAVLLVAGTAACAAPAASAAVPDAPPGVQAPDEYAFGDEVASRDLRAWGPVHDELAADVGKERLHSLPLVLDAAADVAAVRDAYGSDLAEAGWAVLPEQPATSDGAWAHGWTSPDERDVLVLVALDPRPGETHVPLTVLTTLP